MGKRLFKLLITLPLVALFLTGCNFFTRSSSFHGQWSISDYDPTGEGYYVAKGNKSITPFSYRDINYSSGMDNLDSHKEAKLLLIPIEFEDYTFFGGANPAYDSEADFKSDLNIAFNGSAADTGYWESVNSFYQKSSYGKFSVHAEIADIYKTGETVREFYQKDHDPSNYGMHPADISKAAVTDIMNKKGKSYLSQFDTDKDGWIDGIVMIYSCPSCSASYQIANIDRYSETFWAYTYWAAEDFANPSKLVPNLFLWASYSFFHDAARFPKVDCHTIIHEMGHLLGLDDYYPLNGYWRPSGSILMMDENVLDHDPFSKAALGWTEPYVVTGKKNVTLNISPSQVNGDCIIIPALESWNNTAFSEYLIMDLYTPTGLNELDATTKYVDRSLGFTVPGIRLFHVDARLVRLNGQTGTWTYSNTPNIGTYTYQVAASNCYKDPSKANVNYSLLSMIDAGHMNDFKFGDIADDTSLFQTGDTFTMLNYGTTFPNGTRFNDGSSNSVTITFDRVTAEGATISFAF